MGNEGTRTHHSALITHHSMHGSVLLYVVWAVLLLSVFATSVASQVVAAINLSDRLADQLQSSYITHAAVSFLTRALAADRTQAVDGLHEMWSDNPAVFSTHELAGGTFTVMHRAPDSDEPRYGMVDEDGKLSLNAAPAAVLAGLMEAVGGLREQEAQEVAVAIEDWRDTDDVERPDGAESIYYRSLRDGYDCKNGPLENVEELLLIRGVTPDVYERVRPYVTVYGSGRLNLNTASTPVLQALGLSAEGIEGFTQYRAGEDNTEGTDDDRLLTSVGAFASDLNTFMPTKDIGRISALAAQNVFGVKSTAFRAEISATLPKSASAVHALCVIDRDGRVRLWSER